MPSEKYPIYVINKWNGGQTISLLVGGRSLWPTGLPLKENSYKARVKTRRKHIKWELMCLKKSRDAGTNTGSWGVTQSAEVTLQLLLPQSNCQFGAQTWESELCFPEEAAVRDQVTSRGSGRDWSGFNPAASSSLGSFAMSGSWVGPHTKILNTNPPKSRVFSVCMRQRGNLVAKGGEI